MIKTLGEDLTVDEARRIAEESKARLQAEERSSRVKGILINRDPPISTGWCGYDECLHTTLTYQETAMKPKDVDHIEIYLRRSGQAILDALHLIKEIKKTLK